MLELVSASTGVPLATVCATAFEMAVAKLLSFPMVAVIELEPASSVLVLQIAVRPESVTDVHPLIGVDTLLNKVLKLTLPVGRTPALGVTVAVRVTC